MSERLIMAIETSCDETAVSIINPFATAQRIKSHQLRSQTQEHLAYGGVIPELAARAHLNYLDELIRLALKDVGLSIKDITDQYIWIVLISGSR